MTASDIDLVFLHGLPGTRASWGDFPSRAPARWETWDLLDHGSSAPSEGSLDDLIADLAARIEARERPLVLVGHSFGTWVGLRAAAQAGSRVKELIAIAGIANIPPEVATEMDQFGMALESGALDVETGASIAIDRWLPAEGRRPEHAEAIRADMRADGPRLGRQLRRLGRAADERYRIERSPVPLRVVQCRNDRALPEGAARELEGMHPEARLVLLEGDSHFPHWTHADELARVLFETGE